MIHSNMNTHSFVKASEHEDKDPKSSRRKKGSSKSRFLVSKCGQDGGARRRTPSTLGTLETERAIWLRRLTQPLVGEATTTE